MAKHFIYATADPNGRQDRRIELQWFRDQDVRIASTALAAGANPDDEFVPGTSVGEPRRAWDGQFVELDRQQINHLIRQLRAARDQAYGKDE